MNQHVLRRTSYDTISVDSPTGLLYADEVLLELQARVWDETWEEAQVRESATWSRDREWEAHRWHEYRNEWEKEDEDDEGMRHDSVVFSNVSPIRLPAAHWSLLLHPDLIIEAVEPKLMIERLQRLHIDVNTRVSLTEFVEAFHTPLPHMPAERLLLTLRMSLRSCATFPNWPETAARMVSLADSCHELHVHHGVTQEEIERFARGLDDDVRIHKISANAAVDTVSILTKINSKYLITLTSILSNETVRKLPASLTYVSSIESQYAAVSRSATGAELNFTSLLGVTSIAGVSRDTRRRIEMSGLIDFMKRNEASLKQLRVFEEAYSTARSEMERFLRALVLTPSFSNTNDATRIANSTQTIVHVRIDETNLEAWNDVDPRPMLNAMQAKDEAMCRFREALPRGTAYHPSYIDIRFQLHGGIRPPIRLINTLLDFANDPLIDAPFLILIEHVPPPDAAEAAERVLSEAEKELGKRLYKSHAWYANKQIRGSNPDILTFNIAKPHLLDRLDSHELVAKIKHMLVRAPC